MNNNKFFEKIIRYCNEKNFICKISKIQLTKDEIKDIVIKDDNILYIFINGMDYFTGSTKHHTIIYKTGFINWLKNSEFHLSNIDDFYKPSECKICYNISDDSVICLNCNYSTCTNCSIKLNSKCPVCKLSVKK
jgi:hypothetical protein